MTANTSLRRRLRQMVQLCHNTRGAFSPFMFGLLFGVGLMSLSAAYIAKQRLDDAGVQQKNTTRKEAEQLVKGLETALRSQTASTYSDTLTLEDAKAFSTGTTGKNRGGEDFVFKGFTTSGTLGRNEQQVLVSGTTDELLKEDVGKLNSIEQLNTMGEDFFEEGSTFSSEHIQREQIQKSFERMDEVAGHIYTHYAMFLKFPDQTEYNTILQKIALTDVWGQRFNYNKIDDNTAEISFTTPWGYTREIKLSLK